MKTFYVDVYFLINFTVDTLALVFACRALHIPVRARRVVCAGLLASLYAVGTVFLADRPLIGVLVGVPVLFLFICIVGHGVSARRLLRLGVVFLALEILIGGGVYCLYGMLDRVLGPRLSQISGEAENRRFLLFALIVLLLFGLVRLLMTLLSHAGGVGSVRVRITLFGETLETEAMTDSGNLLTDPMDMSPVLIVKEAALLPIVKKYPVLRTGDPAVCDPKMLRRIRFVPVHSAGGDRVLVGFRPDAVTVGEESVSLTVVLDKEGGTFGGYHALIPASVVGNVENRTKNT